MRFYENRGTEWLDLSPGEMSIEVKAIEAERQTQYVHITGHQSAEFYDTDKCVFCGTPEDPKVKGCFCRKCNSCVQTYLADKREEYDEGLPRIADCPECVAAEMEQAEQARIDEFNAGLSERERLTEAGYLHELY